MKSDYQYSEQPDGNRFFTWHAKQQMKGKEHKTCKNLLGDISLDSSKAWVLSFPNNLIWPSLRAEEIKFRINSTSTFWWDKHPSIRNNTKCSYNSVYRIEAHYCGKLSSYNILKMLNSSDEEAFRNSIWAR